MLIKDSIDCHRTLHELLPHRMPFKSAEQIVELLLDLETQARKYNALHDRLLNQYGTPQTEDESKYTIPAHNAAEFKSEIEKLNAVEYNREKKTIPIIPQVTPKELMYLREFFIFEGTEPLQESGDTE